MIGKRFLANITGHLERLGTQNLSLATQHPLLNLGSTVYAVTGLGTSERTVRLFQEPLRPRWQVLSALLVAISRLWRKHKPLG